MLFYFLIIFCVTSLVGISYAYPNKNNLLQWLILCILICVAGFRHHVGIDYDWYIDWYVNKTRDDKLEFGFLAMMKLFRTLNCSYTTFFFFFSLLTLFSAFFGIKKYTKNVSLALLFFFLIPELYLCSFNLIRQSFSVCISFYAFYFLINKKYFIFIVLMFLAISVHNSATLPLLVFLVVFKYADRINSKCIALILTVSIALSYLDIIEMFGFLFKSTRYSYYFDSPRASVSFFKIVVLNSVAFFVLLNFEKMKARYDYQKYMLLLYFCSVVFMNLFNNFANVERLTYFFKIFEIVVVADLICLFAKERKILLFSFFYVYYVSAFIHTFDNDSKVKSTSKLIPYKTFILEKRYQHF